MKNIVFAVFSLFLMMPAVMADCNTPVTISYVGNQEPDDDEFLYVSEREYLLANQGVHKFWEKEFWGWARV